MSLLHALEAAARHDSFSRAASDLGLTQGAVSRQIAQLEDWLGKPLFSRNGRRIALNPSGRVYLDAVGPALAAIRQATSRAIDPTQEMIIEVASLPGFGMRWLAPRMPRLTARHPELIVNIAARTDIFNFTGERFDAAIHVGSAPWPGTDHERLFRERVVPVIAPALIEREGITTPLDLRNVPLLLQSERRDVWDRWFSLSGLGPAPTRPAPIFGHFLMLAHAVVAGAGAALLPTFLIEPELSSGALTIPFDIPLAEDRWYSLVYPPDRLRSASFRQFRDWLLAEVDGLA